MDSCDAQRARESRVFAVLKSAAGPVISYAAALLLALGCTATIFLVIAAKTQSIPLYSREGGLQLVSAGELDLDPSRSTLAAAAGNATHEGGGSRLRKLLLG